MASTVIRGAQIKDSTVQRHDLDTSTVGQAVVTKLVQGSGITLSSTGADSGTGDVTVAAAVPIADNTQSGLLRQVSGNTTDFIDGTNNSQALLPVIWSATRRVFNSLGNPTFEVDQRNVGNGIALGTAAFALDRWQVAKTGTSVCTAQQLDLAASGTSFDCVPGTNFRITSKRLRLGLTTQQATLGAGDLIYGYQQVEGPRWRGLSNDVHSISLLVFSTVAPLKFSVALRDQNATHSLVKLCTIPAGQANIGQLITLPNLPKWSASGVHSVAPGTFSYYISITLACGSTLIAPAADTWQNGNFVGAPGMDNWAASAVNSIFDVSLIQHEPGAQCTTPMDLPFTQNYDDCLRYFQKSYDYGTAAGTVTNNGIRSMALTTSNTIAIGPVSFYKPMAKVPTVTIYNPATGAANSVQDSGAVNHSGAASGGLGLSGFGYVSFTTAAGPGSINAHYIADTGW